MKTSSTEFKLEQRFKNRLYFVNIIFFIILFIFFIQLFRLQIINGAENKILSKRFVSREEFKVAPRGFIFDRKFNINDPLVYNINYLNFVIYPSRFSSYENGLKYLLNFCKIMGRDCSDYSRYMDAATWKSLAKKNEKIILIEKVSRQEHERIAIFQLDKTYGNFESNHIRYYPLGPSFAHVSGYIGPPSKKEISEKELKLYQTIGKNGLEAFYDKDIRGKDGIIIQNKIFDKTEQLLNSQQGNHLVLNIDKNLQLIAYKALIETKKRGTVIVMKANTGEILALASYPSFDPNLLSDISNPKRIEHIKIVSKFNGFLNLAIQAKFPPASTFKSITAIAALEFSNPLEINENTTYYCPGSWKLESSLKGVPDSVYYCHKKEGHGKLDLIHGIAQSCNVYFYNLGHKIGPSPIINTAKNFRLDSKTNIDLPGETVGFVPDQLWKQIRWSSKWYDGDTINLSIGQGFIEVTPIAMAVAYSAIANDGKIVKPFIVREIRESQTGRLIKKYEPTIIKKLNLSKDTLNTVRKGLREVVLSGTGKFLNQPNLVPIAGKTGTVQTHSKITKIKGIDHAWFIGFAPYDEENLYINDRIVVVVFVEHGLAGSYSGVPIAYKIFKEAFPEWKNNQLLRGPYEN